MVNSKPSKRELSDLVQLFDDVKYNNDLIVSNYYRLNVESINRIVDVDEAYDDLKNKMILWAHVQKTFSQKLNNGAHIINQINNIKSREQYETLTESISSQLKKVSHLNNHFSEIHDDIKGFYLKKFGFENILLLPYINIIPREEVVLLNNYLAKKETLSLKTSKEIYSELIHNSFEKVNFDALKTKLSNFTYLFSSISKSKMKEFDVVYGDNKIHIDPFNLEQQKMILAMSSVALHHSLGIYLGGLNSNIFYRNLDSLEAYYPKREIEPENLNKFLAIENYCKEDAYNQVYSLAKLRIGATKEERNSIKAKIFYEGDDVLTLKYMVFGINGKKIDFVATYKNEVLETIKHLDYSKQKIVQRVPDIEFKTYDEDKKLFVNGFEFQDDGFLDDSLDMNNNNIMYISECGSNFVNLINSKQIIEKGYFLTSGPEKLKLNLAAIGGEALLETNKFIEQNYASILTTAKEAWSNAYNSKH